MILSSSPSWIEEYRQYTYDQLRNKSAYELRNLLKKMNQLCYRIDDYQWFDGPVYKQKEKWFNYLELRREPFKGE